MSMNVEGKQGTDEHSNQKTIYKFGKLLGRGGFADVYQATRVSDSKTFAIKVTSKGDGIWKKGAEARLKSEIDIMRKLDHPRILKYQSSFEDSQYIYLVLELCERKSLSHLLVRRKTLSEIETKHLIKKILLGLQYLKCMNIVHRDIKVCNIMLTDGLDVKIGDFGLAAYCPQNQRVFDICGTPNYMPPEIIKEEGHSFEVDIWSTGVLMYNLLIGKCPFEGETKKETYQNIVMLRFKSPDQLSTLSEEARDLLRRMLCLNQRDRIKIQVILSHPFFQKQILSLLPRIIYTKCLRKQELMEYCLNAKQKQRPNPLPTPLKKNPCQSNPFHSYVYLRHFKDLSSKFGLCYQLTNRSSFILFNDSTSIAYVNKTQQTFYKCGKGNQNPILKFERGQVPLDICIRRKYFALKYYVKINENDEPSQGDDEMEPDRLIRVLRCWARSKVAYMFSLRNLVQIYYLDGSFLLIEKKTAKIGLFHGDQVEMLPANAHQSWQKSPYKEKLKLASIFIKQLVRKDNLPIKRQYI